MKQRLSSIVISLPWPYITICTIILFFSLGTPVDLDLGWHLRYGQYFYQTGRMLRENIISFVWPAYRWVEASWGYDVLLYPLFRWFGFAGISVAAALSTLIIFLLVTWSQRRAGLALLTALAAVFLLHSQPLFVAGFRAQTLSAIFFALAIVATSSRRFMLLPVLFWVWANVHGGFVLGLLILWTMWLGSSIIRRDASWRSLGISLVLSSLTPLINPYGTVLYEESLLHATNTHLAAIGEWTPLFDHPLELSVMIAVALLAAASLVFVKKVRALPEIIALISLTFLAASALRFVIPFGIFVTYLLAQTLPDSSFFPTASWAKRALVISILMIVVFDISRTQKYFVLPPANLSSFTWDTYCKTLGTCSEQIAQTLRTVGPQGNGFHSYNWGGYLTWRAATVKTFVDGRMITWEQGNTTPPIDDAERVLTEKDPITWRRLDSAYHFVWAIVPTTSPVAIYLTTLTQSTAWKLRTEDSGFILFVKSL